MTTWKELEGKYLLGIMPDKSDNSQMFIFTKDGDYRTESENKDYSYYDNYKLAPCVPPPRDDTYKTIGETIAEVWADGEDANTDHIHANMDKWIAAVGKGSWGPKEGEPYTFIVLKTATKRISFTTTYCVCHYPSTMWDLE